MYVSIPVSVLYFVIGAVSAIVVIIGLAFYFVKKEEKENEEILNLMQTLQQNDKKQGKK